MEESGGTSECVKKASGSLEVRPGNNILNKKRIKVRKGG